MTLVVGCSTSKDNSPMEGPGTSTGDNLLGVVWVIERYTAHSGGIATVAEETKYQFLFESQTSNLQAFIGCVNYPGSSYVLNDGFITIRLGFRDDVECNTDTVEFSTQSIAISDLLEGGGSGESVPLMYSISEGQLTLEAADGRLLELVEVSELLQQE